MAAVFAAEHDVFVAHDLLDQRVSDRSADGNAAGSCDRFGHAAAADQIVEDLRAGITLGKIQDVREVRAAPRVDALRVIADDRDVVMLRGQQVN